MTRYFNYLFKIPYLKTHSFCTLFLSSPNTTWRALAFGTQLKYSLEDLDRFSIMSTMENLRVDKIESEGLTHYKAYLKLLSDEPDRVPKTFEDDLTKMIDIYQDLETKLLV